MNKTIHPPPNPDVARVMAEIFGTDDMRTMDLFAKFKIINRVLHHLFDACRQQHETEEGAALSHARMRILIRLEAESRLGNADGVQPSQLSRWMGVNRNTISALLNGLEEQNLIERHLHPTDRRQISIRLTEAGHALVQTRAPQTAAFVNSLFEGLSEADRDALNDLLDRVLGHLHARAEELAIELPVAPPDDDA